MLYLEIYWRSKHFVPCKLFVWLLESFLRVLILPSFYSLVYWLQSSPLRLIVKPWGYFDRFCDCLHVDCAKFLSECNHFTNPTPGLWTTFWSLLIIGEKALHAMDRPQRRERLRLSTVADQTLKSSFLIMERNLRESRTGSPNPKFGRPCMISRPILHYRQIMTRFGTTA